MFYLQHTYVMLWRYAFTVNTWKHKTEIRYEVPVGVYDKGHNWHNYVMSTRGHDRACSLVFTIHQWLMTSTTWLSAGIYIYFNTRALLVYSRTTHELLRLHAETCCECQVLHWRNFCNLLGLKCGENFCGLVE